MIDIIPIEYYSLIYNNIILIFVLGLFFKSKSYGLNSYKVIDSNKIVSFLFFIFILAYIGFRPIHGIFVDMLTYSQTFQQIIDGSDIGSDSEFVFNLFITTSTKIMTVESFFFACACLYIIPLWLACKKWFPNHYYYAFIIAVASFSFYAYGTNGIRNGIATSLLIFAFSREKRILQFVWIFLAINFHTSVLLPAAGFLLTMFYNKPKTYLLLWTMAIPVSLILGSSIEAFFGSLGFSDDRLMYFNNIDEVNVAKSGFRLDFLLYSILPIVAGWFYIFKKNFEDVFYNRLFNTYLFANAFWILVIRANFSNRFAYLSWFMMGFVLIYPLLKKQFIEDQHKKLGNLILLYFLFTYLTFILF